jgi:hypothetical protein
MKFDPLDLLPILSIPCIGLGLLGIYHEIRLTKELRLRHSPPSTIAERIAAMRAAGKLPAVSDCSTWNNERCQTCLDICSECNGLAYVNCKTMGCGGQGFVVLQSEMRPRWNIFGFGFGKKRTFIIQSHTCSVCEGSGLQVCPMCHGTKVESTGRINDAPGGGFPHRPYPGGTTYFGQTQWLMEAPRCLDCNGSTRVPKEYPPIAMEQFAESLNRLIDKSISKMSPKEYEEARKNADKYMDELHTRTSGQEDVK